MPRTSKPPPAAPPEPPPPQEPASRPTHMPVFVCRHRALKAAVWRNDTETGPMFNTTVTRSYKDGDAWRESTSFGWDDLLTVSELLRTCFGFVSREMAKQSGPPKS